VSDYSFCPNCGAEPAKACGTPDHCFFAWQWGEMVTSNVVDQQRSLTMKMDFGDAIRALKDGKKVRRRNWNGEGMWLALQVPDEHSKMGLPYIYMSTVEGKLVPWLASQSDMLSEDWEDLGEAA